MKEFQCPWAVNIEKEVDVAVWYNRNENNELHVHKLSKCQNKHVKTAACLNRSTILGFYLSENIEKYELISSDRKQERYLQGIGL